MIQVNIYKNSQGFIYSFAIEGHADYAKAGSDIVCAAVSALVFNTINSIETFTDEPMEYGYEDEGGFITCIFPQIKEGKGSKEASLLLNALVLGLQEIYEQYSQYIHIEDREV